ncbi:MAG: RCC1 domain-containing protein [Bdellovibrio sp.]
MHSSSRRLFLKISAWFTGTFLVFRQKALGQYNTGAFWKNSSDKGTLWAMGDTSYGEVGLGLPTTTVPKALPGEPWVKVVAHPRSLTSFAFKADGTLWAWGLNLSLNITSAAISSPFPGNYISSPVQIPGTWANVIPSANHTTAFKSDGTVWGWGSNGRSEVFYNIGIPTITSPVQMFGGSCIMVAANDQSTHAIKTDGTLWFMGDNYDYQSGIASPSQISNATQIGVGSSFVLVAGGGRCMGFSDSCASPGPGMAGANTMAIKTNGTLWVCGVNGDGQLGLGHKNAVSTLTQAPGSWTQMSVGENFSVGCRSDGTWWSCGSNKYGQLGDGTTVDKSSPVQLPGSWQKVIAATYRTYGLKADGTLYAWGFNDNGVLGVTTNGSRVGGVGQCISVPTQIPGSWSQVAPALYHTLALDSSGAFHTWGNGSRLGPGTPLITNNLLFKPGLGTQTKIGTTSWAQLAKGGSALHAFGIKADGTAWGWGANQHYQLGVSGNNFESSPVQVMTDVQQVAIGRNFSMFLKTDGTLFGVGQNDFGQVTVNSSTPTQIAGSWLQVACGARHTLGIKLVDVGGGVIEKQLWGWGANELAQVTYLSPTQVSVGQTRIGAATNWKQVAGGESHSMALREDGTVYSWGYSYAAGAASTSVALAHYTPGGSWSQIAAGNSLSVGIKPDSTMHSWGEWNYAAARTSPTQTTGSWAQVSVGYQHIAGVQTNGSLWAWCDDSFGQVANGFSTNTVPKQIPGSWSQVTAGAVHTLAIKG